MTAPVPARDRDRASRRRREPTAHTWCDGGGMVVRCDDPEVARPLMVAAYLEDHFIEPGDYDSPEGYEAEVADLFPIARARVETGRMLGALPGSWIEGEGWSWAWYPCSPGRGTTVAVVWQDNR